MYLNGMSQISNASTPFNTTDHKDPPHMPNHIALAIQQTLFNLGSSYPQWRPGFNPNNGYLGYNPHYKGVQKMGHPDKKQFFCDY